MERRPRPRARPTGSRYPRTTDEGSPIARERSNNNELLEDRLSELTIGGPDSISAAGFELQSRDSNDRQHVDTDGDQAYVIGETENARHYAVAVEGETAIQAMRNQLGFLLPTELITNEYGEIVPMEAVPRQHLAKLQSNIWHELPAMVAVASGAADDDSIERIVTAKAVYWLGHVMSRENHVFILNPPSDGPCRFALCERVHKEPSPPYSQYEVSIEPLVDWMTIDPVLDASMMWFSLYRRNKNLLFKFALSNKSFVPPNTLRLCFGCMLHLINERRNAWCTLKKHSYTILAGGPSPWRELHNSGHKDEESKIQESSGTSDPLGSEDYDSLMEACESSEDTIPTTDGALDGKSKAQSKTFEVWRDSTSQEEPRTRNMIDTVAQESSGHDPISPRHQSTDGEYPAHGPSSHNEHSNNTSFNTWTPINVPPSHNEDFHHTRINGWTPINARERLNQLHHEVYEESVFAHTSIIATERQFGNELDPNTDMVERDMSFDTYDPSTDIAGYDPNTDIAGYDLNTDIADYESIVDSYDPNTDIADYESSSDTPDSDSYTDMPDHGVVIRIPPLPTTTEGLATPFVGMEPVAPLPKTNTKTFQHDDYVWPASKDTIAPIPARPMPGYELIPKSLYPNAKQPICSCKKPADIDNKKVVQCRNPECFVRWYHYDCLDKSGKGAGRHGTFLCDVCVGEEYWAAQKMEPAGEEIFPAADDMDQDIGVHDPYGLCMLNGRSEVNMGEPAMGNSEGIGAVYHNDEDNSETHK